MIPKEENNNKWQSNETPPELQKNIQQKYTGSLPSPELLKHYGKTIANAGERFMTMTEELQVHKREMDKLSLAEEARKAKRGQVYGLIIWLTGLIVVPTALAVALYFITTGYGWYGVGAFSGFGIYVLVVVVTAFIRLRKHNRDKP